jgi:hypothetical protein
MNMKKIVTIAGLWLLVAAVAAHAEQPLSFKIPFDFNAGNVTLAAGSYEVSFPHQSTVLIRGNDSKHAAFVMTTRTGGNQDHQSKLVFNRYGDRYFLSQIWAPGYDSGRRAAPTKTEKELASRQSSGGVELATVLPERR